MTMNILVNLVFIAAICFTSVAVGAFILLRTFQISSNSAFLLGGGYFVGMSVFMSALRIITSFTHNLKSGAIFSLCLLFVLTLPNFKHVKYLFMRAVDFKLRAILATICFLIFLYVFLIGLWFDQTGFHWSGSLHADRYAAISDLFALLNDIPVINQNSGQAILSAIPSVFGYALPNFSLNMYLFVSVVAIAVLFFGLLRVYGASRKLAVMGSSIVMLGNCTLSLSHVLILDSGSPWLFVGYFDSLEAIATALIFIVAASDPRSALNGRPLRWNTDVWPLLLPFCFGISSHQVGPQNLLILLPILGLWFILSFWKRFPLRLSLGRVVLPLIVGSSIGFFHGGMTTPRTFHTDLSKYKNEGTQKLMSMKSHSSSILLYPVMPYRFFDGAGWRAGKAKYLLNKFDVDYFIKTSKNPRSAQVILWSLEEEIWTAARIMFFPLLGITLFWVHLRRRYFDQSAKKLNSPETFTDRTFLLHLFFAGIASISLCLGFLVSFSVAIFGYKWELSRFSMLGNTMGMLILILAVDAHLSHLTDASKNRIFAFLCFLTMFGPLLNNTLLSLGNLSLLLARF
ncbi:MAG: hypothetical protein HQL63_00300 [Magnetococcales bacterium]|nr:hypothetical protein [Magnetococcales bacterium]MBF0321434.1 hypothetical protein [Magnetococcales bacterium]